MTIEIGELIIEAHIVSSGSGRGSAPAVGAEIDDARLVERVAARVLELLRDEREQWA